MARKQREGRKRFAPKGCRPEDEIMSSGVGPRGSCDATRDSTGRCTNAPARAASTVRRPQTPRNPRGKLYAETVMCGADTGQVRHDVFHCVRELMACAEKTTRLLHACIIQQQLTAYSNPMAGYIIPCDGCTCPCVIVRYSPPQNTLFRCGHAPAAQLLPRGKNSVPAIAYTRTTVSLPASWLYRLRVLLSWLGFRRTRLPGL